MLMVAVCLGLAAALGAGGQGAVETKTARQQPGAPKDAPKKDASPWRMTFDELVHNDNTGEGEATRVVATSDEDTVIQADLFTWNDKKKTARATGSLRFSDDQADGTAERADIEYAKSRRLMVLTGNVRLNLKARKAAEGPGGAASRAAGSDGDGGLREQPIEITCDRLEYEYAKDKRRAVLTGNLRAVQKLKDHTRTLTAARAEWFGKEERVTLAGPVRVEDTKGRKGETPEDVTILTREGNESIKLRKGVYTMPADEDQKPDQKPPERDAPPPVPSR
jgi:lipopolysaccharide export system protein LptA